MQAQIVKVLLVDGFGDDHIERRVLGSRIWLVHCGLKPGCPVPAEHLNAQVVMTVAYPIDKTLMNLMPELRLIVRCGSGVDNVDLEAARRNGIAVANVPDASREEAATHALALLLACARRLFRARQVPFADYQALGPVPRLSQLTLGIIGMGRIGRAFATLASPLVREILWYDPLLSSSYPRIDKAQRVEKIEALLRASDLISLHCPLTCETRGLINRTTLALAKPGAILINTARGALIDEEALAEALAGGRIAAAGADVLAAEPPPEDHPLLALPNFIYTPHLAWYSVASLEEIRVGAAREVLRWVEGRPLRSRIV